jgi:hypothetical protein
MLPSIEHKRLRWCCECAHVGVPEGISGGSIKRFDATAVAQEHYSSGCGQQADTASGQFMPPGDLAGFIVNRIKKVAEIQRCAGGDAAKPIEPRGSGSAR